MGDTVEVPRRRRFVGGPFIVESTLSSSADETVLVENAEEYESILPDAAADAVGKAAFAASSNDWI